MQFKEFDAFPKVESGFVKRTGSGGILTLMVTVILCLLVMGEIKDYMSLKNDYSFLVDPLVNHELQINLDITVAMPCECMSCLLLLTCAPGHPIRTYLDGEVALMILIPFPPCALSLDNRSSGYCRGPAQTIRPSREDPHGMCTSYEHSCTTLALHAQTATRPGNGHGHSHFFVFLFGSALC